MEFGMNTDTFEAFQADALNRGFDEVLVREWTPGQQTGTHTHPFAVEARVVRGDFVLTVGDQARELAAGDGFELAPEVPHSESYGPEGATFWVARRRAVA
jgi:quercetin dioxygenase-like cupin family protein